MAGDEKAVRGRYEPEESAQAAYRQFTSSRGYEDALIMTDIKGELWPFKKTRRKYKIFPGIYMPLSSFYNKVCGSE